MPARTSYEKSVFLSVCPSVKSVHCDKTEERSVQIFYTEIHANMCKILRYGFSAVLTYCVSAVLVKMEKNALN